MAIVLCSYSQCCVGKLRQIGLQNGVQHCSVRGTCHAAGRSQGPVALFLLLIVARRPMLRLCQCLQSPLTNVSAHDQPLHKRVCSVKPFVDRMDPTPRDAYWKVGTDFALPARQLMLSCWFCIALRPGYCSPRRRRSFASLRMAKCVALAASDLVRHYSSRSNAYCCKHVQATKMRSFASALCTLTTTTPLICC